MNLNFKLTENQEKLMKHKTKEEILFCVPANLSENSKFSDGKLVVTESKIFNIQNDEVEKEFNVKDITESKVETGIGACLLTGMIHGKKTILARFELSHIDRYAYIFKAICLLKDNKTVNIVPEESEKICAKCGRLLPPDTSRCPFCVSKITLFKRLWDVSKNNWRVYVFGILVFGVLAGFRLLIPYIHRILIDDFIEPKNTDLTGLIVCVVALGLTQLLQVVITIIRGRVVLKAGEKLGRDLRAKVYNKIQELPMSYIDSTKTGDMMNRINGDTGEIGNFIINVIAYLLGDAVLMVGVAVISLLTDWKMTLLIFATLPIGYITIKIYVKNIRRMFRKQRKLWDKANSTLQDILTGIRVIKSFGIEKRATKTFEEKSKRLTDMTIVTEKYWNTGRNIMFIILGLGYYLLLTYGGIKVTNNTMPLGKLVQFSQYAGMLIGPLFMINFMLSKFASTMTSLERIFEIIERDNPMVSKESDKKYEIDGNIVFDNVSFGYCTHQPVLENISVNITKGEMLGLVGHSGCGKSTFINLVMRLYDIDGGSITIDGINIKDIPIEQLRTQIGVVLQETFLFSGSVYENIRYSKPTAPYEEIINAAKIANAHDFIIKFTNGYDTIVGERGQKLSGGEKQRIAIARAVLCDPKILILDEATSSLDTETEQKVQEALGRLIKDRTTIAIAHRLSTLRNADRLLVIEKGKLAEIGTHQQLMRRKKIYYGLVKAQRQMQ